LEPVIDQYHDTSNATVLLAEHREGRTSDSGDSGSQQGLSKAPTAAPTEWAAGFRAMTAQAATAR
jgi:hypothetical protein